MILKKKLGDAVQQGEPIIEIHHRAEKGLAEATSRIRHAIFIGDNPLSAEPLVWETIS
jgi:thymidine phosphorylase